MRVQNRVHAIKKSTCDSCYMYILTMPSSCVQAVSVLASRCVEVTGMCHT